jgi:molecular chaperone DnaK (HSP70)
MPWQTAASSGGFVSQPTVVVDFGTSHTVAVVSVPGGEDRLVTVDGEPWLPSAVFAARDGRPVVGVDAIRLGVEEPARVELWPKARIGEGEVLLGDVAVPVGALFRAVLREVIERAVGTAGGPIQHLVLTHPADWGTIRLGTLRTAAHGLTPRVTTVPEPVAAAAWFAEHNELAVGEAIGVLDFGGGTCDAAAVRRESAGLTVLGCAGLADLGGNDLDRRILDHAVRTAPGVGERIGGALPGTPDELRELARLREGVRAAKERLSDHPLADVALPGGLPNLPLTRQEFETLIAADIVRAVGLLDDTVRGCGLNPRELVAVQLAGGSSRIPLLATLLAMCIQRPLHLNDQPETVVALGGSALLAR